MRNQVFDFTLAEHSDGFERHEILREITFQV